MNKLLFWRRSRRQMNKLFTQKKAVSKRQPFYKIDYRKLFFVSINSQFTKHLLDPEQLVVFADPVGSAA